MYLHKTGAVVVEIIVNAVGVVLIVNGVTDDMEVGVVMVVVGVVIVVIGVVTSNVELVAPIIVPIVAKAITPATT